MPDPYAEWWTLADVAAYLDVKPETAQSYRHRKFPKGLPEAHKIGRTPVWRPERIIRWNEAERPGRGAGGGPKPKTLRKGGSGES
jgi:hypothetical protein